MTESRSSRPRTSLASVLFILGLRGLTAPDTARRGMQLAALGMLLAIVGTLLHHEIVRYDWIVGRPGGRLGRSAPPWRSSMPMTAMPQRIAISHAFGALAATLVGIAEYDILRGRRRARPRAHGARSASR